MKYNSEKTAEHHDLVRVHPSIYLPLPSLLKLSKIFEFFLIKNIKTRIISYFTRIVKTLSQITFNKINRIIQALVIGQSDTNLKFVFFLPMNINCKTDVQFLILKNNFFTLRILSSFHCMVY